MSTLNTTNLKNASSGVNNIVLDASGNANAAANVNVAGNISVTGSLVPSSSFLRNRLINGDMRIDQRNSGSAATLNNASFTYTPDRWAALVTGSTSTVTTQRVASGVASFPYVMRILRGSGTFTGSTAVIQEIETVNCQDLAGQTVTVSFWARKGSAASQTSFYIQGISGSGTDQGIVGANTGTWTGWAAPVLGTPTLTTTLTQYSYTWSVPAGTNEMAVYFVVNSYTGTGSANDYVDITGFQLEAGSVATPFERRAYGQELALCQRYFSSYNPNIAVYGTTAFLTATIYNPVTFRTAPTVSIPYTDGNYTSSGTPTGSQWNAQQIFVSGASKTGTVTLTQLSVTNTNSFGIAFYGCTFSQATNWISCGASVTNITASAEL